MRIEKILYFGLCYLYNPLVCFSMVHVLSVCLPLKSGILREMRLDVYISVHFSEYFQFVFCEIDCYFL